MQDLFGGGRKLEKVKGCRKSRIGEMLRLYPYKMETDELELYECINCGHIQAEYLLSDNFYDEYEAGSGLDQYVGNHCVLSSQFKKLRSMIEAEESTLLEIGSGTGNAIRYAAEFFDCCIGVEPSFIECEIARKNLSTSNTIIFNCYFDNNFNLNKEINAFCSFQVFEHLEDLYTPMKKAYDLLCDGGVGLINVPNGLQIMEQGLYHQVNFEHINYYTPYSIALLAKNCGFDVIDVESDVNAIEINAYVRKRKRPVLLNTSREYQKERLREVLKGLSSFAIYGAGAKTLYYSSLIDCKDAKYLFDSDEDKQGLYIGGVPIPVSKYSCERANACDGIVIFASSYSKEIIKRLRDDGFKGRIIFFEEGEIKVDERNFYYDRGRV